MTDYDRPYRKSSSSPTRKVKGNENTVLVTQMIVSVMILLFVYCIKLASPNIYTEMRTLFSNIMQDNRTYEYVSDVFKEYAGEISLKGKEDDSKENETTENMSEGNLEGDVEVQSDSSVKTLPIAVAMTNPLPSSLLLTDDYSTPPPESASYSPLILNVSITVPVTGNISSKFGYRTDPVNGKKTFHRGLDIAADSGTPILAAFDGMVISSGYDDSSGNYVEIQHDEELVTAYYHCSELIANTGDVVKAGDVIAKVGSTGKSTGPHLHFEIRLNGIRYDPSYVL